MRASPRATLGISNKRYMASRIPRPVDDRTYSYQNRRFSQYAWTNGVHYIPVDEGSQDRADEFGEVLSQLFGGRTVLANWTPPSSSRGSVNDENLPTILDCGCSRGAWISSFLEEHGSDFLITGVDVFFGDGGSDDEDEDPPEDDDTSGEGVQEFFKRRWNLNARFSDAPTEYGLLREAFDLINSRLLCEGIHRDRWRPYARELFSMLKPGGWLQMMEMLPHIQSYNGSLSDRSYLTRWWDEYVRRMELMNRNPRIARNLVDLLRDAGFAHNDVAGGPVDVPIGTWFPGREAIGEEVARLMGPILVSLSLVPFVRIGEMPESTYWDLMRGVTTELHQPGYKLYFKVYCARGRRSRRRH